MSRIEILTKRMYKLELMQSKISNLMMGHVFGGELPADVKEKIKTPEIQNKLKSKIGRAERLRLEIAKCIYDELIN